MFNSFQTLSKLARGSAVEFQLLELNSRIGKVDVFAATVFQATDCAHSGLACCQSLDPV